MKVGANESGVILTAGDGPNTIQVLVPFGEVIGVASQMVKAAAGAAVKEVREQAESWLHKLEDETVTPVEAEFAKLHVKVDEMLGLLRKQPPHEIKPEGIASGEQVGTPGAPA